ncbi:hypothetical protein [Micromonospora fulviviridis]|uniref:Uncharacterized protein n=1 Tax=Micromonospora fulviviridis TaxID=47860 RepID=A0ABV2VP35_9ACTN
MQCSTTKAYPVWQVPCQPAGAGMVLANDGLSGQMPVSRTPITMPAPVSLPGFDPAGCCAAAVAAPVGVACVGAAGVGVGVASPGVAWLMLNAWEAVTERTRLSRLNASTCVGVSVAENPSKAVV